MLLHLLQNTSLPSWQYAPIRILDALSVSGLNGDRDIRSHKMSLKSANIRTTILMEKYEATYHIQHKLSRVILNFQSKDSRQ